MSDRDNAVSREENVPDRQQLANKPCSEKWEYSEDLAAP